MTEEYRRWYDRDPILKEALELLRVQPEDTKAEAADFMIKLQDVYQMVKTYENKGNRWYDKDPVMLKAIELLRVAPPSTQRKAALKILLALEENSFDNI